MEKALLNRFGETNLFFWIAVTLCTERVKEPEKSYLLKDNSNFGELILEIETNQPIGVLRRKSFLFEWNDNNLKEAENALLEGQIANLYIRRSKPSDTNFRSFVDRLDNQAI